MLKQQKQQKHTYLLAKDNISETRWDFGKWYTMVADTPRNKKVKGKGTFFFNSRVLTNQKTTGGTWWRGKLP